MKKWTVFACALISIVFACSAISATISIPLTCSVTNVSQCTVGSDHKSLTCACDAAAPVPTPVPSNGVCPKLIGTTAPTGSITVNSWTQRTGNIHADYFGFGSQDVDATSFVKLFNLPPPPPKPGVPPPPLTPWPGDYNADPVVDLPINQHLSLGFKTPPKYFSASNAPTPLYGEIQIGESGWTVPVSMTISTSCGDFGQLSPSTVVPGCKLNRGGDSSFFSWSNASTCVLHDNQQYYLNVIAADISTYPFKSTAKASVCPGNSCSIPLINGPGDWVHYVPTP